MAAQCGVKVAPSIPSIPIIASASARSSQRRSSSPKPKDRASAISSKALVRCTSVRAASTVPPLAKWQSIPSACAVAPTMSTVACMARRMARMASRP